MINSGDPRHVNWWCANGVISNIWKWELPKQDVHIAWQRCRWGAGLGWIMISVHLQQKVLSEKCFYNRYDRELSASWKYLVTVLLFVYAEFKRVPKTKAITLTREAKLCVCHERWAAASIRRLWRAGWRGVEVCWTFCFCSVLTHSFSVLTTENGRSSLEGD
jgi:hypothetical protein